MIRKHGMSFRGVDESTVSTPSIFGPKQGERGRLRWTRGGHRRRPVYVGRQLSGLALSSSLNWEWGSEEWGTCVHPYRRARGDPPTRVRGRGLAALDSVSQLEVEGLRGARWGQRRRVLWDGDRAARRSQGKAKQWSRMARHISTALVAKDGPWRVTWS